MSRSLNTFAIKVKVHCKDCGLKLEKKLLNITGVCSVNIDQKLGKVVISGKVDPAKVLRKLKKRGREAELWPCEQLKVNNLGVVQSVEVTITTKLTFQGQSTSNYSRITQPKLRPHGGGGRLCSASSSCCSCHHGNTSFGSCYANNRNNYSYHNVPTMQSEVLAHGGGLCSASSSCCGCHHANTSFGSSCANNRNNYFYHNVPIAQSKVLLHGGGGCGGLCGASSSCCGCHNGNTSFGSCCANNRNNCSYHCPLPLPMGFIPDPLVMPPPWSGDRTSLSAPPLPSDYFPPSPSPPASSCASFLSQYLRR